MRRAFPSAVFSENPGNLFSDSSYLLTSREFDADTGLQYNRARWYDSKTGRWISEDPLGFAAGDVNTARYVGNGVVGSVDHSGFTVVKLIFKVGRRVQKVQFKDVTKMKRWLESEMSRLRAGRGRSRDVKVFVHTRDHRTARDLAKSVSPKNKAVWHSKSVEGYPGHYHPVLEYKNGRPVTKGTPHIGPYYTGSAQERAVIPLLIPAFKKTAEIAIDVTPAGDVISVVVDGRKIFNALDETIRRTQENQHEWYQLNRREHARGIDRLSKGDFRKPPGSGHTRAGDWRWILGASPRR